MTKHNFAESMRIIANRLNISALTIFKILRIFRKKISFFRFVKSFDKQKIFVSASIRSIRHVQVELSISNVFEIATFSNFSSNLFFFASLLTDFRDFFSLRRFRKFVDFRFSKFFKKSFAFLSILLLI